MKISIQKAIASSGYASRRQAEKLIKAGQVTINDKLAMVSDRVDIEVDQVKVNGKLINTKQDKLYLILNKPKGYTCSNRYFPGEKNIFSLIKRPERLFAVGRLDKDSRGLVLITNDGDLALKLSHPRYEVSKEYEVRLKEKEFNLREMQQKFVSGIDIGEKRLAVAKSLSYLQNNLFSVVLREGKKRQIKRMFAKLNLTVLDLKRVSLAGIELGKLSEGQTRELKAEELNKLLK